MTENRDNFNETYNALIERIVNLTLEGKIRAKSQVYNLLAEGVKNGTGEIFERCLTEKIIVTRSQLERKIKATRVLRALETIESEWEKYQKTNQQNSLTAAAIDNLVKIDREDRLLTLVNLIDPNQNNALTLEQLQQLAKHLQTVSQQRGEADLWQIATGINLGLNTWSNLSNDLTSWLYEQNRNLGFTNDNKRVTPWQIWASKVNPSWLKRVLESLANQQAFDPLTQDLTLTDWVETAIVFQYIQRGLINFFDQRIYSEKLGAKLSISTFLTFALIWSMLTNSFERVSKNSLYSRGCFQMALQILRTFAQRDYFPLYGGIFASFSGSYLKEALDYLSIPLRYVEGTGEKARILTLIAYSNRIRGDYQQARECHQQALEIARQQQDYACEIANLNHLSRLNAIQKNYTEAINLSQRALILSRQQGNSLGQVNALANLGYSQVQEAQQLERYDPEIYQSSIEYLQQGLKLAESLQDWQSKSLCCSSLGLAYLVLERPQEAINILLQGLESAKYYGDVYLQGLLLTYLGEAYYQDKNFEQAIYMGSLGMYWLHEIGAVEWRQAASLLTVIRGKNIAAFEQTFSQERSSLIKSLGLEGYQYISEILSKYQQGN
ncbi:MAG: tetratricopeptide repeat protein [Microcystis viridis Mv_BB_P_19951000_S69]|uniref:Tetratricopeptide repeat protein n=1 Tax=Microcystis viridis Mv_BB_P_19951000_S68D TaxID=2486270 RepID=A0A552H8G1_MICVR|nr:MAG: tetratricopeptide repeat protein [Microcystis viridis Mv_BB_P_19951000_S68D]TRU69722.1 MAG: tetratricopeptide repeat protein [Microcystis viridis Mv_BB_P_19951000_S69]TRU78494.1 MAG: tetratricopeptide repeat protein [Microcystis viridis Mv_BB_P_19951000_S68]TRU85764.1 MAG: tetratricopeptide repeat protein [Microcystis viridis Mv_BB_P_19951000_S69D]